MERYCSQGNPDIKQASKMLDKCYVNWFFMSPVSRGLIGYSNLFDGTLTLFDLFKLNEALDYQDDVDNKIRDMYQAKRE